MGLCIELLYFIHDLAYRIKISSHSLFFPERARNDVLLIKQWCVQINLLALLTFLLFSQSIIIRLISGCFTRWHTIDSPLLFHPANCSHIYRDIVIVIFCAFISACRTLIFLCVYFSVEFETKTKIRTQIQMNMTGGVLSISFFILLCLCQLNSIYKMVVIIDLLVGHALSRWSNCMNFNRPKFQLE